MPPKRPASSPIPRVAWEDVRLGWRQGEHVTLVGPTGQGKTTLAKSILPQRNYVLFLATKPRDDILHDFRRQGYRFIREFPSDEISPRRDARDRRVVFLPKLPEFDNEHEYRDVMSRLQGRALRSAFYQGAWTIYLDELMEHTKFLGLANTCERIWLQGRSNKISFVTATQHPAWVPLAAYNSATHLFFWRDSDERRLKRLSEVSGTVDKALIKDTILSLPRYHFLYVNTRTGNMLVSKCPK